MRSVAGWVFVLFAAFLLSASSQATTINGSIGFVGTFTQSGGTLGDLSTATSMKITNVAIAPFSATGDLTGATTPHFASPIDVNGHLPSLVGQQLWSVKVGALTYTYTVLTESQPFTSPIQLNLEGTGVMHDGNPADDTFGVWQLGFGRSGRSFTWQSTAATLAPEPGTLALLGSGLLGLIGVTRRKLAQ